MTETKGKLYLIPSPLGENDPAEVIPAPVLESLGRFRTFVVEEVRTARRYLSRAGLRGHIGELEFHELNEHTDQATIESYIHQITAVSKCPFTDMRNAFLNFDRTNICAVGIPRCNFLSILIGVGQIVIH